MVLARRGAYVHVLDGLALGVLRFIHGQRRVQADDEIVRVLPVGDVQVFTVGIGCAAIPRVHQRHAVFNKHAARVGRARTDVHAHQAVAGRCVYGDGRHARAVVGIHGQNVAGILNAVGHLIVGGAVQRGGDLLKVLSQPILQIGVVARGRGGNVGRLLGVFAAFGGCKHGQLRLGQHQPGAAGEDVRAGVIQLGRKVDLGQAGAVFKRALADAGHVPGQRNLLKVHAAAERARLDGGHAVGNFDLGNRSVAHERLRANGGKRMHGISGVKIGRNFHARVRSIIGDNAGGAVLHVTDGEVPDSLRPRAERRQKRQNQERNEPFFHCELLSHARSVNANLPPPALGVEAANRKLVTVRAARTAEAAVRS